MRKRVCGAVLACTLTLTLCGASAAEERPVLAPSGLFAGPSGVLVIADLYHRALWWQEGDGTLIRLAGREGVRDVNGVPLGGYNDGDAAQSAFQTPWAVAPYLDGWVVTDTENHAVRYLGDGSVSTLAGTGKAGFTDAVGVKAAFDGPTGLAVGQDGYLYVADTGNNAIRRIDAKGTVTTYVDGKAGLLEPTGLCWEYGALYVADSGNNRICRVEDGTVTPVAGVPGENGDGYRDGRADAARFSHPQGVAVDGGVVYVADTGNGAVRAIRDGVVYTLMNLGEGAGGLYPVSPRGLAFTNGELWVGDVFACRLFALHTKAPAFEDVSEGAWYAPEVTGVGALGLMDGVAGDRFAPGLPLTGDVCAALAAKLKTFLPEGVALPQVSGGERTVGRSELAALLWRCAGSPASTAALDGFADAATISAGERAAMAWCVEHGLLVGRPGGVLDPAAAVTRAEAAVLVMRFIAA